jgi:uncharacterized protein (DUF1501 family)
MKNRREFIQQGCTALGMAALGAGLGKFNLITASAQTSQDYKALVCIFLFGGNDGNNTVIPLDQEGYGQYAAVRTTASGINLAASSLHEIVPPSLNRPFGLHPSLGPLVPLWTNGHLAVVCNTGPLVAPMTRQDYLSNTVARPLKLFSHSDQTQQWQTSISSTESITGWGGRLGDRMAAINGSAIYPMVTSVAGSNLFMNGVSTVPLVLPPTGTFRLNGFNTTPASQARYAAMVELLNQDQGTPLVDGASDVTTQAIQISGLIDPIITSTNSRVERMFAKLGTGIGNQLLRVAKIIEKRHLLGVRRQIFFCSIGGFDTHNGQVSSQASLFNQLGLAMATFYRAIVKLGVESQVTTFTLSDFGRTFVPASGAGTDHAWGNHHFVMGGAVRGGDFYGTYPSLALGTDDDTGSEGRWIPTTSVDQYAATLAQWYGAPATDLPVIFPNIGNFATDNVGFMLLD